MKTDNIKINVKFTGFSDYIDEEFGKKRRNFITKNISMTNPNITINGYFCREIRKKQIADE